MTVRYERKIVDVRVSQRMLRIDAGIYPLTNISRVDTDDIGPRYGMILMSAIRAVVAVAIGLGAFIFIYFWAAMAAYFGIIPDWLAHIRWPDWLVILIWPTLLAIPVVWLVRHAAWLRRSYVLAIETSGSHRVELTSADRDEVHELRQKIIDAINNPNAEFHTRIESIHIGDRISQFGNRNIGKAGR